MFYASGGEKNQTYYIFEEKSLEWKMNKISNFTFPILASFLVIDYASVASQ
jgi:hypothetical protein